MCGRSGTKPIALEAQRSPSPKFKPEPEPDKNQDEPEEEPEEEEEPDRYERRSRKPSEARLFFAANFRSRLSPLWT